MNDPKQATRMKDLRKHLESKGHEVYFPGQKQGECKKRYLVVKDGGLTQYQQVSSDMRLYDIMAYVPKNQYGDMEAFLEQLRQDMKSIYPLFVSTHYETPSFFDDTVEAWMVSVQYRNVRKFNHN